MSAQITIQKRVVLTIQGAKDFCEGVLMTTPLNLALRPPAVSCLRRTARNKRDFCVDD
jgi:hypothetical protein